MGGFGFSITNSGHYDGSLDTDRPQSSDRVSLDSDSNTLKDMYWEKPICSYK